MGSTGPESVHTPDFYESAQKRFVSDGIPNDAASWLTRAEEVPKLIALTATERDLRNASPAAEVILLKASGLTKILGPAEFGGGAQPWSIAYKAIRTVARGDGSIGMILGYHLLWSTVANVVGTKEQQNRLQKSIIENNWFIGGAVNPRDADLTITEDGDDLVFNGFKHFNTGGVVSDVTWLEGTIDGRKEHIFALAPSRDLKFSYNWGSIGLKGTESGSVKIENVRVAWTDALGWDGKTKKPIPSVLGIPFATLLLPTWFSAISIWALGKALSNLHANIRPRTHVLGRMEATTKTRLRTNSNLLSRYGSFQAHLLAAEALAEKAGDAISSAYADHGENRDVSARRRGDVAEIVAAAKFVTTDTSLRVISGIFEVTGAKATSRTVDLDRFWRDVRTHTLHDPVAYKEKELGRYVLLDEVPEPSWYT